MVSKWADGVVARARQEAAGEVWSLVVLPANDARQWRVEGDGHRAEDVAGVSEERRERAVTGDMSEITAGLIKPFVKLSPVCVSGSAGI